jgi:fatty acid desaturase
MRAAGRSPSSVTPVSTPAWRAAVAPYIGPDTTRSLVQLTTTLALLALSFTIAYQIANWSVWAALALAPLSAGLLVRTFIFMHDCAHGSFLPWRRASEIVGYVTGVLTLTPFGQWRRDPALHHARAVRRHHDTGLNHPSGHRSRARWIHPPNPLQRGIPGSDHVDMRPDGHRHGINFHRGAPRADRWGSRHQFNTTQSVAA